jgi:hypothetical protein
MLIRKLSLTAPLLAPFAMGFAVGTAQAGTTLETVNRNLSGGDTTTISTWAQNGMLRMEAKPSDATMIFKDDTLFSINHKDKSYYVMDRASMKKMADTLGPALKAMQEQMKNMTPEQRAQMQKMLGGRMPGGMGEPEKKEEIKRTTRTDKISGYSCTYVQVLEDGVLTDEMCVAPGNTLKGSDELIVAAKRMSDLLKEMMSSMDAPWLKQMAEKQTQNFEKLGGIPVMSRHFEDGKPTNETSMSFIRAESLAASMFDVPSGYTKKDMAAPR